LTDLPGIVGNRRDDVRSSICNPVIDARTYGLIKNLGPQPMRNEAVDISCNPGVDEVDRIFENDADAQRSH